ncbi:MAG: M1 family metallopeptidase [Saprospiraceae bacterium]|nr:M1 family metallopeptidase [Saprospiraceae bacterium]
MKFFLAFAITFYTINWATAQDNYFQQEVNYKIHAILIDSVHTLVGSMEIEYTNNAPNTLQEMYFHLWGNAFKSKTTAFAKQLLQQGNTDFYFANPKNLGGYTAIQFKQNDKELPYNLDAENPDIALVKLEQPLNSGATTKIVVDFTLKIPTSYSRLGHVGESYQMTQWYPKPAVFDRKGWHPMPYLEFGEFYSEFGNFDVSITLPENYVVGATGSLQNESEKEFLNQKIADTKAYFSGNKTLFPADDKVFPASSTKLKTIRYTAERVHDFAWFADKRFRVDKEELTLASGKKVDSWVMFTATEENLWENAVKYVSRAVQFYSENVGEYPYPQATAVQSALSAGAGMEYPMITVIGEAESAPLLDEVITHEVGHNWFYGILATNERDHAWMDEGTNSYYETRYMELYYPNQSLLESSLPKFLIGASKIEANELAYLLQARRHLDQAPETTSEDLTTLNYQIAAYGKPALAFRYLEQYLGTARFDALMQAYYQTWQFKHPYPDDFQQFVTRETGQSLDWFFNGLIGSNATMDYAISDAVSDGKALQVRIKNKGSIAAPFPIAAYKGEELITEVWVEGVQKDSVIMFPSGDYDYLALDARRVTLDLDRRDNTFHLTGFKKAKPWQVRFLGLLDNDQQITTFFTPAFGWNQYDKFQLGLLLHNKSIPSRNFEFALVPMFAFGSERLTGFGTARYNIYLNNKAIERISLQINAKTFSYNTFENPDFENYFYKFAPNLELKLGKQSPISKKQHTLSLRSVFIQQRIGKAIDSLEIRRTDNNYAVQELGYKFEDKQKLNPFALTANLQSGEGFSKLFAHYNQRLSGSKPNKHIDLHLFAGLFLQYDADKVNNSGINPQFLLTGTTGSGAERDYLYDEMLLGRSENDGLLAHQIFSRDAGFKTLTSVGRSRDWMLGVNLRTTLPGKLPIALLQMAPIPLSQPAPTLLRGTPSAKM